MHHSFQLVLDPDIGGGDMEPNYQYSKNNHYKWGWGNDWFNSRIPGETYNIQMGTLTRAPLDFRSECIQAVNDIANNTSKPIIVGLSGGSDSQMVCLSLLAAKIPFTALIITYEDEFNSTLNRHDIDNAYKFCSKFNVPYKEMILNLDKFYTGKGANYAAKYGMTGAETIVQTAAMDYVGNNYCYIMAGGDVMFVVYNPAVTPDITVPLLFNGNTVPCWYMKQLPVMQHMIEMGYEGTSKFYMWSPELIYSYLTDPVMQNFYRAQDAIYDTYCVWHPNASTWWRCFHYLFKPQMTMAHFPEMLPTRKFTGFERLYGNVQKDNFLNTYTRSKMKYYTDILKEAAGVNDDNKSAVILPIAKMIDYLIEKESRILKSTRVTEVAPALKTPERRND